MNRYLIFGGTTEGRLLTEFCIKHSICADVCVATEYGGLLLEESSCVNVLVGRKDLDAIITLINNNRYSAVFDATHPYAKEVSMNVKKACEICGVICYRVVREPQSELPDALYFDSADDIAEYLKDTVGTIFISTGSKEINAFCRYDIPERSIIRILPDNKTERYCSEQGFIKVITGKGPFSHDDNIKHFGTSAYLVTKDSGNAGGFKEKISAARQIEAEILIIRRPKETGIYIDEAENIILKGDDRD